MGNEEKSIDQSGDNNIAVVVSGGKNVNVSIGPSSERKKRDLDPESEAAPESVQQPEEATHQELSEKQLSLEEQCPIGVIDVRVVRRRRKQQVYCLVNGAERAFSIREHEILKIYAKIQAKRNDDPERHKAEVDSDLFNIEDDYNRRHSALSRLRRKIKSYLPEGHPPVMVNSSERVYYLGCYCEGSTSDE